MPELPEVERARRLIAETCTGYVIDAVDTVVDTIVFDGADNDEFANEIRGRTVTGCERKGKQFWITLSGEGRYPVMHFGMTGMIQEPTWYRRRINLGETADAWPPKFHKFIIKLSNGTELAFIDPRRLGRLRLVPDPVLSHAPLSELGFDPVLAHPPLDEFRTLLSKKKGTIKGVIMDQAFSAGVGNWVADEVLYQAHIHPLHPVPALSDVQLADLHRLLREVPLKAIEVNADSSMFPDDWLFQHRWDKGKKKKDGDKDAKVLLLPDGKPATIKFVTVGGRTSAVVVELQKLPGAVSAKVKEEPGVESKAKPNSKAKAKAKGTAKRKRKEDEDSSDLSELSEPDVKPAAPAITSTRAQRASARATPSRGT